MTPDKPLVERRHGTMQSPRHSVLIAQYLLGQYRVKLTRVDGYDPNAPFGHGQIVRELCTYDRGRAYKLMVTLANVADPEAYCRSLERPWNCEIPGHGRIRLDNKEGERRRG